MKACLQAQNRSVLNRSGLRQLREKGRLPSVVFGKHMTTTMIHISMKEFNQWNRSGNSGVIELELDGQGKIPVLLEEVQRDPLTRNILHADFLHVKMDEQVRTKITVEYAGTPAGVKLGGIVQVQTTQIEVEGLPERLPSHIVADISDMAIGETLTAAQLNIPPGVEVLSPAEELLVSIVTPRLEQSAAADAEAGA